MSSVLRMIFSCRAATARCRRRQPPDNERFAFQLQGSGTGLPSRRAGTILYAVRI